MMTELTRLRIKPEKKKRAHDDRERLALRVLATTIDTTRTFTQFDKEIGSIDHVTEPPALDEALQARQDTDARERTQRMRQFVQEHVDKMPLQVLRVGDHIEIGISGVASLKQLKTLEKHPVNLNTLHGHRGKARELMRGRTMSQVLANAGFGDFMGTVVVRDVTSGRQVLRCRRQCIASVRAGQREVAKEHMLTSEKGWAKTCGTERAFNQGYAVAMFRRFSRLRAYGLNQMCKPMRFQSKEGCTTAELIYLNAAGVEQSFQIGNWIDRLSFQTALLEAETSNMHDYIQRVHDVYREELAQVLMEEEQLALEDARQKARGVYLESIASNLMDERLRGLMAHFDPAKTYPMWEALTTCNCDMSNPYEGGELALLNGLLFIDYKEGDLVLLEGSYMHAVVAMRSASSLSRDQTRPQWCRHSAVFFSRDGYRESEGEEGQFASTRSGTQVLRGQLL